jgi:hypothetical protein
LQDAPACLAAPSSTQPLRPPIEWNRTAASLAPRLYSPSTSTPGRPAVSPRPDRGRAVGPQSGPGNSNGTIRPRSSACTALTLAGSILCPAFARPGCRQIPGRARPSRDGQVIVALRQDGRHGRGCALSALSGLQTVIGRVVSGWLRTNSTPPHNRPRDSWQAIKVRSMRNAAFASSTTHGC